MSLALRTTLLAALVLAPLSGAAAAQKATKWVSLYTDRDGETFYDPASVTRAGSRTRLKLRAIATGDTAFSAIMLVEVDCKAQTMGMLSMEQYGAGPQPVRTRSVPADKVERQPMFVGEDIEPIYRAACPRGAPLSAIKGPPIVVVPPPAR
ncbi:hypothetical protein FHS95_000242 [Sphingomonas naasensis]|uniref:Surface-adhesin protein E-like domain-containing protein n=1 Tax=Sphingomonas naasensis TaxID=1344951 RepID=A0A4S1WS31_9SPHN|nr:surface-adhesin E family protein [Sphingomonas naasensis]NIJ18573.1 hypothetical protein [Sphingomonas naasensis]TGX45823.1 hypothetical protein E5A74_01175 [Sphingomonas naasensis]